MVSQSCFDCEVWMGCEINLSHTASCHTLQNAIPHCLLWEIIYFPIYSLNWFDEELIPRFKWPTPVLVMLMVTAFVSLATIVMFGIGAM